MQKKFSHAIYRKGMTLIELMVVLAIFMIVTSTVLFDYSTYRSKISLDNLATDIALSVRKAQTYAIGVYGSGSSFSYGYGIHFANAQAGSVNPVYGSNESFVLFTDVSGNKMYDNTSGGTCSSTVSQNDECSEMLSITSAVQISAIYLGYSNGSSYQVPQGGSVDILFLRPNPDAYFCYRAPSDPSECDAATISNVKVEISNLNPSPTMVNTKDITIWNTGQISSQ